MTGRPWLTSYAAGLDPDPRPRFDTIVAAWDDLVARRSGEPLVHYFDGVLSVGEVDRGATAFAASLQSRGVRHGDRIGVYLQNVPQYLVVLLGIWRVGAVAVPLNPMYRDHELRRLVDDARPVGMVLSHAHVGRTRQSLEGSSVAWYVGTSDREHQTRDDARAFWDDVAGSDADDLADLVARHRDDRPATVALGSHDHALLCFTSGTSGPPKGALSSHVNVLHSAVNFGVWAGVEPGDRVLAMAPLFHITGAILNAMVAVLNDASLVMVGRFQPEVALDAFVEHEVTFTIGSITAFNALLALPRTSPAHFATVKALYSGGAPIPPATVETLQRRLGHYVHNVWGMTETTAGGIAVPRGQASRVDPGSGTLSVGVPTQGARVRVVDEHGDDVDPGTAGELEFSAPQVISGYWEKPEDTARTLPGGRLRTGDVAIMDADGWVYLVDRLKDQINTSGYKVWPREVEDALYESPAVFEAAVVGRPDDYRGEAVVAYVSLREGASATSEGLLEFVRDRLAAYKVPREVHLVDALPKTATGKIRRQEFRDQQAGVSGPRPV